MRTQYVATLDLDDARLEKDLERAKAFRYSEAYSNYLIGGPWKSSVIWAAGGDRGDGVITDYAFDQRPRFTPDGQELPYLQEIITKTVDVEQLQFARVAVVTDSVIIPHRDLIELVDLPEDTRPTHRMHIPLVTNDECFFSQENVVYRMGRGEVWFFDAAQIHSVASFSEVPRIHLILDFADRPGAGPLVTVDQAPEGGRIPASRTVRRPPLPSAERAALLGLADVLTRDTFKEVFGIVIKKHFRYDGGADFAWETMTELARRCPDPQVLQRALDLRRYFELERSA